MKPIFISHADVSLPKQAVPFNTKLLSYELLKVLFAAHCNNSYKTEVFVYRDCVYALLDNAEAPNNYYRVMFSSM